MKPAAYLLCTSIGFVVRSIQVIAFPKHGIGIVILITIALLIAGIGRIRGAKKPKGAIPKKLKNRVVHHRKAVKGKLKVVAGRR